MKANHVYGAESHINGFSGHVVDLLVLAYGSFQDVLQATEEWQPKTIIDVEEHHDTPMLTLNESKTHGPLIVVDPIQPDRNAAAAVNQESYDAFKDAAKAFLKTPSEGAFHIPTLDERFEGAQVNDDDYTTIQVNVDFDDDRHDVSGSRLQKINDHLDRRLNDANFHVETSFIHHDNTSAIILTATTTPTTEDNVIQGPPLDQENHVERFKAAHDVVEEHMGRVIAHEPNQYETVSEALTDIFEDDYVTSRCQRITADKQTTPTN
jgi:tRNA nucleotidyltransferase (CCA-adding enzyme)